MNKHKISIGILLVLLGISISAQSSQGAPKKDSPSKLIEYENCLKLMSDESTTFTENVKLSSQFDNWVSQGIFNCATWKPAEMLNLKSAQYRQCLSMAFNLRYEFIQKNSKEQWEVPDLRNFQSLAIDRCKQYRP